jgi:hypothetical protein
MVGKNWNLYIPVNLPDTNTQKHASKNVKTQTVTLAAPGMNASNCPPGRACIFDHMITQLLLTFRRPALAYLDAHRKTTLKNLLYIFKEQGNLLHFYYKLHNLYFPQKAVHFIILCFSIQTVPIFFINHAHKFK